MAGESDTLNMKSRKRQRENDQPYDNPSKKQASVDSSTKDVLDKINASIWLPGEGRDSPRTPQRTNSEITREEETERPSINSKSDGQVAQHNENAAAKKVLKFEGGAGVNVSVDSTDGEYVLKIKRRKIPSSTDEEKRDQMAETAGKLLLHAEILHGMGEQLLAQYRASLPSIFI